MVSVGCEQGRFAAQGQQGIAAHPWRACVEAYSFLKLIGDVKGKKVLDVACGDGHYTRILRKAGAAEVVGIDLSDRMIELAREREARQPLGIEYRVEDARDVVQQPDFDLVVAAWLLVHARSRAELVQMCRGLASRLSSGGRFVTLTTNPDVYDFAPAADYGKYGLQMTLPERLFEGVPLRFTLLMENPPTTFEDYYLPIGAFEYAFAQAGFRNFAVHMPELSHASEDRLGYWDNFLRYPVFILVDCVKRPDPQTAQSACGHEPARQPHTQAT